MKPIVTLTTIPSRLNAGSEYGDSDQGIKSCINSLINQTTNDYEIHFNIPYTNVHTSEEYIIPEWLTEIEGDILKIFRTEDHGSITKLVPTLQRVTDPEAIIIVCDDDLVYDERMVVEQVNNQSKFPGCAVGYDGMRLKKSIFNDVRDHFFSSCRVDGEVTVVQGYKTVSYKRKYFEEDFFTDFADKTWSDDVSISSYLSYKGIKKMVTFHESDPVLDTLEKWQERGGVTTFPVLRHTVHEAQEGCNLKRASEERQTESDPFLWRYLDDRHLNEE